MAKWFYKQNFLVKLLLLLIPGVNLVMEILIRWSAFFSRPRLFTLIFAIVCTVSLGVFGWIDIVWLLLTGHLLFAKA